MSIDLKGLGLDDTVEFDDNPDFSAEEKELALLLGEMEETPKKAKKGKPKPKPAPEVDLDAIMNGINMDDEIIDDEDVSDSELQDPTLLAELEGFAGSDKSNNLIDLGEDQPPPKSQPSAPTPTSASQPPRAKAAPERTEEEEIAMLMGDMALESAPPKPQPQKQQELPQQKQQHIPQKEPPQPKSVIGEAPRPQVDEALKAKVHQSIALYKRAALECKQMGHLDLARERLRTAKTLELVLAKYEKGEIPATDINLPPPPPQHHPQPPAPEPVAPATHSPAARATQPQPATTPKPKASPSPKVATPAQSTNQPLKKVHLPQAEHLLKTDLEKCVEAGKAALDHGLKSIAAIFVKHKKQMLADLAGVQTTAKTHPTAMVGLSSKDLSYKRPLVKQALKEDTLQLDVTQFSHPKCGAASLYITLSLPVPSSDAPLTATLPVFKVAGDADVELSLSHTFAYERRRSTAVQAQRRKLALEVWKSRGFLRSDVLVGRAELPLLETLTKVEFEQILDLKDEKRKAIGSQVAVRCSVRLPLSGATVETVPLHLVHVESFFLPEASPQATIAHTPTPTPTPAVAPSIPPTDTVARVAHGNTTTTTTTTTASAPPTPSSSASAAPVAAAPVADPHAIDLLVSNDALEYELEEAMKLKQTLKRRADKGDADAAADLEDVEMRITDISTKLNLLVIMVQRGQLTMEAYCDQVKTAIAREKKNALSCKVRGDTAGALRCLTRAKIMTKELEEE